MTRTRTNSDSSSNASNQSQLQLPPQQSPSANNFSNNNNNMPPPKKIPGRTLCNVFPQRSSPPNNFPLSPPSASFSTESDASSVSIDETDFPHAGTADDGMTCCGYRDNIR